MKLIPLTQGMFAQIDDEDEARVAQFKWFAHRQRNTFYAGRNVPLGSGCWQLQHMHVFLMDTPPGFDTHHVNENGLDNQRKANLRIVSRAEHERGEKNLQANNTSGFKGVHFYKRKHRWQAYLKHNGRRFNLGYHDAAEEAAHARDAKARELGWPESGMNFPQ